MKLNRCLAAVAVLGVLAGCSSTVTSSSTSSTTTSSTSPSTSTTQISSSAEATTSTGDSSSSPSVTMSRSGEEQDYAQGKVKVLGEFTDHYGFRRLYLVVPAGLSDDDLIALAKAIHEKEQKAWLWMLDDDSQGALMMEELSKATDGSSEKYPLEWIKEHTVAHSKLVMVPKEDNRWVLYKGVDSDELAVLGTQKGLR